MLVMCELYCMHNKITSYCEMGARVHKWTDLSALLHAQPHYHVHVDIHFAKIWTHEWKKCE